MTSALDSAAASRAGGCSARPMGTPASVSPPGLPLPLRAAPGTRSGAILVPTRAPLHLSWRSMTATQAGQPAQDPDDDAPGGTDVDSTATTDAGQADAAWTSAARPAYDERAGGGTAERIAALRARLMTPMPDDRLWGWIGPLLVTAFAAFMRFNRLSVPDAVIFDETYYAKD